MTSHVIITCTSCGEHRIDKTPQCACWAVVNHVVLGEWTITAIDNKE